MILIFSNNADKSSIQIVRWLEQLKASFLYLDEHILHQDTFLDIHNNTLRIGRRTYNLCEFYSVWIRRPFSYHNSDICRYLYSHVDMDVATLLKEETSTISTYLYDFLRDNSRYFLANSFWNGTNKLRELKMAQTIGLRTPQTLVTTAKEDIISFFGTKKCISKSLFNSWVIYPYNIGYEMYTSRITEKDLNALPVKFAPSMIQEEIPKEYDIRTFFLDGELFSMAILPDTMLNDNEVDCRRGNTDRKRLIPIMLDKDIGSKITKFMKLMGLKIGSIDLIKGIDGCIYFLEVNHEGQIGMIDIPCNYGIHRMIAKKLFENDWR